MGQDFNPAKSTDLLLSTSKKSIENPFKAPSHLTWPYLISTNVRLLEKISRIINYYEICTIIKRAYAKVRMTKMDSKYIRTKFHKIDLNHLKFLHPRIPVLASTLGGTYSYYTSDMSSINFYCFFMPCKKGML